MRSINQTSAGRAGHARHSLMIALFLLLTGSALSCSSDTTAPSEPFGAVENKAGGANTIVVSSTAELVGAVSPENAGRRILLRAGSYELNQPLIVPDRVELEGEGVMLFDGAGLPTGFAAGTRTTLRMVANAPGDVLTLGNGASVRRLAIEDLPGRAGNVVGVVSRDAGDRVSAAIVETEIVNPSAHRVVPSGPAGCGIAVLTLNPNMGGNPPPHSGAAIAAQIRRSLIRSPAMGTGCGLFAFNFAPLASVSVAASDNVFGGGMIAAGGVSRPDFVHDSRTVIQSRNNLYRDDTADPCVARRIGWNLQGGAGTPVALSPIPGVERNALDVRSQGDRIEGFTLAVLGYGGRRYFTEPLSGPVSHNSLDLELLGATVATSACGGATFVSDFRLFAASVSAGTIYPGDGNTVRAVIRNVTGSGVRFNAYADVSSSGSQPVVSQGSGNRLRIVGSPQAFARTNDAIDPAPAPEFFTGGGP